MLPAAHATSSLCNERRSSRFPTSLVSWGARGAPGRGTQAGKLPCTHLGQLSYFLLPKPQHAGITISQDLSSTASGQFLLRLCCHYSEAGKVQSSCLMSTLLCRLGFPEPWPGDSHPPLLSRSTGQEEPSAQGASPKTHTIPKRRLRPELNSPPPRDRAERAPRPGH